ncbi:MULTISPECIES: YceI family protein [Corynebacterium]|uniref:Polyisoprenoid-binding protein YceI n=1 Tax=Corynebacterium freneyi TaxID=134034 RepID=A0ABS4U8G2_9CORY|nr:MULTISPECIES: YceI family protein [Corynebacterium]MBP2332954.1 polyisoprenoid-binding protein YceI [Corynebacterium freneyi]MCG7438175.1 YceI family protein [Corynebacterium freneyi]OFU53102.1 hypothetical protein HMPREF3121_09480 [Corynebacterium sp. HMSC11E11]QXA52935.1 YceI family protein [Corynebacterium freneyi]UBI03109.1 YceI family protein [Corynebacterium freneyi]
MTLSPNFAGTWNIDAAHSQIGFMVRHAMVTKTRGRFTDYTGSFTVDPDNGDANAANVAIKGVTKSIDLDVEFEGTNVDAFDQERIGLTASGSINRKDFGVDWQAPLNSGVMVSDKVVLEIEVSAVKA